MTTARLFIPTRASSPLVRMSVCNRKTTQKPAASEPVAIGIVFIVGCYTREALGAKRHKPQVADMRWSLEQAAADRY